ncbi:UNVERIFIED_CONTAM: hypothetical protein PYX00_010130 [Menopon gallinae]|uniref:Uncharacterized protein n=1 Tax=Menopon gallinae TaxID=328185 RepID=A0AAW2HED8_9NEOP
MVERKAAGDVGHILHAYLQRPYYWSWGGIPSANVTNKWPKKEDRLKKSSTSSARQKSVKLVPVNSTDAYNILERNQKIYEDNYFTDNGVSDFERESSSSSSSTDYMIDRVTSVLPTRSSTVDYQLDVNYSKWNFSDSIDETNGANVLNGSKANEVYVQNRTVVLVTGDSFLPKLLNDTIDYGSCHNGSNWSNVTDCDGNYTVFPFENDDALHLAAMVATAFVLGLIILATVIGKSIFHYFPVNFLSARRIRS